MSVSQNVEPIRANGIHFRSIPKYRQNHYKVFCAPTFLFGRVSQKLKHVHLKHVIKI